MTLGPFLESGGCSLNRVVDGPMLFRRSPEGAPDLEQALGWFERSLGRFRSSLSSDSQ